ncbi:MAG: hypothetical protein JWP66_213 [Naasia sp.]|nr:hypothetical protein [Naasia sp.]
MTSLRFATVGDNTIDQYFGDENVSYVGGNAVNVAVQLRLLGNEVDYAGAVGDDEDGRRIRAALEERGIGVDGLEVLPGITSISQIIVRPDGERVIGFEDFATSADYRPDTARLDTLSRCTVVHIGMSPFAAEIRRELKRRGTLVSQDCAVSAGYDSLDVAFGSAGADEPTARRLAEEALAGGATLAVVTQGAAGSIAYDGTTWWSQAADPVTVVDTTGAGDSFIAGFLSVYGRGGSISESLASGAASAASTCGRLGAFEQPSLAISPSERRPA